MKIVLDTHAHTIVSGHAYNTIREMAQMAKEKGLEAFALTEHAPQMPGTCHEFYFQNLHIVPREMYGVRLFMGVELNIMNEKGEVDLPESTLCQMDIAIASIHGPCYKGERTEEAITAAYLAAMENPLIHIIGHPDDGRYPVDYEQLAKKAKETGTVLEVNNGSLRPGGFRVDTRKNDLKMLEYCKKYEVPVTMGRPEKTVVNIAGDGCFRMNMNEVATAARYNIPIIQVVVNNHVLGMVRQWQNLFYGQRYSATVLNDAVDFVKLAEAMGAKAVRATTREEFADAFKFALNAGGPVVIDCQIDSDDKVWPMVAPGAPISEAFDEKDLQEKQQTN